MNGNGQVVVAGLFLLTTMAVAMVAVGLFELPAYEPEAKPIELLEINDRSAQFSPAPIEMLDVGFNEEVYSPAPIELLLQNSVDSEQGMTPEQIYRGITAQTLAKSIEMTKISAHRGACSAGY